jgi:hypothetical protein
MPDVDLRGDLSPSIARAHACVLACVLFAGSLALASPARVARAQDPARSARADCREDFSAQVAEAIWLRDGEQAEPAGPARGSDLDARTRFSLAVVIGDLLILREQAGTAGWPRTLSRLSSQELRRRRDEPALDATACEIVRFMREHYSAERDGTPAERAVVEPPAESAPSPSRVSSSVPALEPLPVPAPAIVPPPRSMPAPALTPPRPPAPPARPAPRAPVPSEPAAQARAPVPTPPPARPVPESVPVPERSAVPEEAPKPVEIPRAPAERPRVDFALLPDEEPPAPPPPVAPPDIVTPLPAPLEPEPPAVAVIEQPVAPEPPPAEEPPATVGASAKGDLAALETQLAAPRYLTLRAIRRNGTSRPDDEVWRLRRETLQARDELVRLLRKLSGEPGRLSAVKALLGAKGCTQLEKRLRELYVGGPDSEKGDLALELWRRQP